MYKACAEGKDPFQDGVLPGPTKAKIAEVTTSTVATLSRTQKASDGATKMVIRLHDDRFVETVLIPTEDRTTVCVSSQVGCGRGCMFCRTATMGMVRNLGADEIVSQVVVGIRLAGERKMPPVRNVVFMGMGEPLDNLKAVQRSLEIMTDNAALGIAPKHVTVSTVGTTKRAIQNAAALPGHLAWSLQSAVDEDRNGLIPTNKMTVEAMAKVFVSALKDKNEPLFVEVVLIHRLNDDLDSADAIAKLFEDCGVEIRVNLIGMNPVGEDGFLPSPPEQIEAFQARIRERGLFCSVRKPRGQDKFAACGQLAVVD